MVALDGNAIGGLLLEVFGTDMTDAEQPARHRGDSTASAAASGTDPDADVEGDRTLNS